MKAGYGSYEEINNLPLNIFIDLLHYEEFCGKYENAYYDRLRQKNKR